MTSAEFRVRLPDAAGSLVDFKKDLAIEKPIGKGGFGIIYKAVWRHTVVAVKMLMLDKDGTVVYSILVNTLFTTLH